MPPPSLTRGAFGPTLPGVGIAIDTLEYARRLREAGFSEQQAEGQAQALAAAMTDTLATKQDLHELSLTTRQDLNELRAAFEHFERHIDTRLVELEKRMEIRFDAMGQRFDDKLSIRLADLERRMTLRLGGLMVAGVGFLSAMKAL